MGSALAAFLSCLGFGTGGEDEHGEVRGLPQQAAAVAAGGDEVQLLEPGGTSLDQAMAGLTIAQGAIARAQQHEQQHAAQQQAQQQQLPELESARQCFWHLWLCATAVLSDFTAGIAVSLD